jgi:isopenicillin N synthase-like dioxygenase
MMSMPGVPVISIADLRDPATLAALDEACRDWGFFQVVRHGIDASVVAAVHRAMRDFFAEPPEAKRAIMRTAENPWGYYDQELTKNTRDWKEVFDYGPASGEVLQPQWPEGLAGFRDSVLDYYRACETLAFRLLDAVSVNLGMPAAHLRGGFVPEHSSFVRFNHYPPCPTPAHPPALQAASDGYLGINHHTDAGALTILFQDAQPGLEVFRHGRWHLVEPRDDALVVNIGDVVQVWSNDRYQASLHRVIADASVERFSAPFFLNPAYAANYAPLPAMVDFGHPPHYRSINWGEFRGQRAAGDYTDLGEEIQISHYRI